MSTKKKISSAAFALALSMFVGCAPAMEEGGGNDGVMDLMEGVAPFESNSLAGLRLTYDNGVELSLIPGPDGSSYRGIYVTGMDDDGQPIGGFFFVDEQRRVERIVADNGAAADVFWVDDTPVLSIAPDVGPLGPKDGEDGKSKPGLSAQTGFEMMVPITVETCGNADKNFQVYAVGSDGTQEFIFPATEDPLNPGQYVARVPLTDGLTDVNCEDFLVDFDTTFINEVVGIIPGLATTAICAATLEPIYGTICALNNLVGSIENARVVVCATVAFPGAGPAVTWSAALDAPGDFRFVLGPSVVWSRGDAAPQLVVQHPECAAGEFSANGGYVASVITGLPGTSTDHAVYFSFEWDGIEFTGRTDDSRTPRASVCEIPIQTWRHCFDYTQAWPGVSGVIGPVTYGIEGAVAAVSIASGRGIDFGVKMRHDLNSLSSDTTPRILGITQ